MQQTFERELNWAQSQMPLSKKALSSITSLNGVRLACSMHLDLKMIIAVEGFLRKGARIFLTTCNPQTVRDEVVTYLKNQGAEACAWQGMKNSDLNHGIEKALEWEPTHLCEMGADLTVAYHKKQGRAAPVRAALEATGSGIEKIKALNLRYPIYNWDDIPLKECLHNRYMVGLMAWHAFLARTKLTLHGKRVIVVGFGLVGKGVAEVARNYGGAVVIAEKDPVRAIEARFAGWDVQALEQAISVADVVVTATGAVSVLNKKHFSMLKDGVFLVNVGHHSDEIDVAALLRNPSDEIIPHVKEISLESKKVYLFANGGMANLVAGDGDSLNAFDVTLALMIAGVFQITSQQSSSPGLYLLPQSVWAPFFNS